ncbi:uncharacterized protein PpBr36_11111 [Pyricularia pennisetigena]|uniref:uncharacterized protein n=1 Tax=Pyricularia pennisetigena TaxID=1578925 RepID=UPI0011501B4E|nr:uncharacterized protein PpBr36_11111 [Pyricularia pennisetigena]TLS20610.1 hypothetical protein PpBr36_11111 [Pyricularia pennisetigena]
MAAVASTHYKFAVLSGKPVFHVSSPVPLIYTQGHGQMVTLALSTRSLAASPARSPRAAPASSALWPRSSPELKEPASASGLSFKTASETFSDSTPTKAQSFASRAALMQSERS